MPRLHYYVVGAAAAGGVYYAWTTYVYEPYTTVTVAAEKALEAGIFFNQRFLQRAQLLSRELTSAKSSAMQSLYIRCMLLREDALDEEGLAHDALFTVIDEALNHRCLPLLFRAEELTRWQAIMSAMAYATYVVYFKWCRAVMDLVFGMDFGTNLRVAADSIVARALLSVIAAPVQLLDWRSEVEAADCGVPGAGGDGRSDAAKGLLVDYDADKGERTDAQRKIDESNRGEKNMWDMIAVHMSHDSKVETVARMRAATRGVTVPAHLYVLHVHHWIEDVAARAAFPAMVSAVRSSDSRRQPGDAPPPRLVTLHKPTAATVAAERRALALAFTAALEGTAALRTQQTQGQILRRDADDFDSVDVAYAERRGLTSSAIIKSPIALRNMTNYAVAMRHKATHVFRFGYPWAASTDEIRRVFAAHHAQFATPVTVAGARRFIDLGDGDEAASWIARQRNDAAAARDAWKSGRETAPVSNLGDADGFGTVPTDVIEKRKARRGRLVEKMRLEDEDEARRQAELSKHQTTGKRADYFELNPTAISGAAPSASGADPHVAFGDPNAGATAVVFDTPLSVAPPATERQSLAIEVQDAVDNAAKEAAERRAFMSAPVDEAIPSAANWNVYGDRARGGRAAKRLLRVIVTDPVDAEHVWSAILKAAERLHEAEEEAARFKPSSLGA